MDVLENVRCPYCGTGFIEGGACPQCGRIVEERATDAGVTQVPKTVDTGRETSCETPTSCVPLHHLPYHSVLKDRYLVERVLGEGGFGITYAGFDQVLDCRVAIKEYFPVGHATRNTTTSLEVHDATYSTDTSFERGKKNFLNEARTMARVGADAALCGVIDFFEQNGTAYIVMDFVEGTSLADMLRERGGKIGYEELMGLLVPVIDALGKMHAEHLVHRDLSPDNIMVSDKGAILIDFGCAREFVADEGTSKTMTIMLKYDYAAPEQYGRGGQGPWTDVFGMCAVIYRCLTGQLAPRAPDRFSGERLMDPSELVSGVPEHAERAIVAGLSLLPKDRPQSMGELKRGLVCETRPSGRPRMAMIGAGVAALAVVALVCTMVLRGLAVPSSGGAGDVGSPAIASKGADTADETLESDAGDDAGESAPSAEEKESDGAGEAADGEERHATGVEVPYEARAAFSAGGHHSVAIVEGGEVRAAGSNESHQSDTQGLSGCVAVAAGDYHTVGLRPDGTVMVVSEDTFNDDLHGADRWKNVTAVSAGAAHTVGLVIDGTVVAAGNNQYGQCDVERWEEVSRISAGTKHTLGLRSDGTVVAVGENTDGRCDVSEWRDIVDIAAGGFNSVGLNADGTVRVCGSDAYGQLDVDGWHDIVSVSAGCHHVVGLTADGHVVAVGLNDEGQCDVEGWEDVEWVHAGLFHTVALRKDGTLVAVGRNVEGQCDVSGWKIEGESA